MDTKIIKQNLYAALVVGATITLAACASKPSPWSQQASPWDSRQAEVEPVAEAEPLEPVGMSAMESAASAEDSEYPVEPGDMVEPQPVVMAEPEPEPMPMMEAEPMPAASGGVMSQPANHYAVQVVASSSMEGLRAFARQHQLSDQWTAETSVNGKTWFVLLLGVYPTKTEANDALASVQGELDTSPWIRSVGSLQAVAIQ
ncbi:MAG: SPOR domain-containing protein [Gammaproteobacteria bacterium]|nr:SPOR domain-containing protein [Gammaproteobacteria bacterium]